MQYLHSWLIRCGNCKLMSLGPKFCQLPVNYYIPGAWPHGSQYFYPHHHAHNVSTNPFQLSLPNQAMMMIENGTTIKEMLHVTCYMSHVSFITHKSQLPEQQGTMVAETALLTSTKALKNNSFAPTSFFLRISFHGKLPPNLRNERMVCHY